MRAIFDEELSQVGQDLVQMATLAAEAIRNANKALASADLQLAEQVIESDIALDELERALDERCVTLLARQQPVATDLRTVVSGLRISASIERMGDLARHVAQLARLRYPEHVLPDSIKPLFNGFAVAAEKVALDLVELLQTHDLGKAAQVEQDDDILDELHRQTFTNTLAEDWDGTVSQTVDVTLLGRFYERFGDHAVSVANRITYLVTGDLSVGGPEDL